MCFKSYLLRVQLVGFVVVAVSCFCFFFLIFLGVTGLLVTDTVSWLFFFFLFPSVFLSFFLSLNLPRASVGYLLKIQLVGFLVVCFCFVFLLILLKRHWATCYIHSVLAFLLLLLSFGLTLHRASLGYLLQAQCLGIFVGFLLVLLIIDRHWATCYRYT